MANKCNTKGSDARCNFSDFSGNGTRNVAAGCHSVLFAARNVAKVKLDSTKAAVARNVERKVAPCPGL